MKLKVGIIGAGSISHRHIEAYSSNPRVESVCAADPDPQAREKFLERFTVESFTDRYEEMLEDKSIQIIDICDRIILIVRDGRPGAVCRKISPPHVSADGIAQ